jgi:hypothetical protein
MKWKKNVWMNEQVNEKGRRERKLISKMYINLLNMNYFYTCYKRISHAPLLLWLWKLQQCSNKMHYLHAYLLKHLCRIYEHYNFHISIYVSIFTSMSLHCFQLIFFAPPLYEYIHFYILFLTDISFILLHLQHAQMINVEFMRYLRAKCKCLEKEGNLKK